MDEIPYESVYVVQVLRDETMADTASVWVNGQQGKRQVIILAGLGHCHESAIVRRMQRRGIGKVVSVRPILASGNGEVAAELADPITDYLFVMSLP